MKMYNKVTGQQGKWATIEGMEFLDVDGGKFIKKEDVGSDWVEFSDETTKVLLELVDAVEHEKDVHFLLLKDLGTGAQIIGHQLSDRIMLEFIVGIVDNFVGDDHMKLVMLMMALKEAILEDLE